MTEQNLSKKTAANKEEEVPDDGEAHGYVFGRAEMTFLVSECICILLYGLFTEFGELTSPLSNKEQNDAATSLLHEKYPLFQDVHVMIFIGFGFLMVFLKNNSWCSIGFNYLIACWAIQIAIIFTGLWHNIAKYYEDPNHEWKMIELSLIYMILGDFAAGAVLISFGAILGKVSLF
jgi:ammonium transporter Rh